MSDLDIIQSDLEDELNFFGKNDDLSIDSHQFEEANNLFSIGTDIYLDKKADILIDSGFENNYVTDSKISTVIWSETEDYQPCFFADENFDFPISQVSDHFSIADLDNLSSLSNGDILLLENDDIEGVDVTQLSQSGIEFFDNSNLRNDVSNTATLIDIDTYLGSEYFTDYKYDQANYFVAEAKWKNKHQQVGNIGSTISQDLNNLSDSDLNTFSHVLDGVNPIYEDNDLGMTGGLDANSTPLSCMGLVAIDDNKIAGNFTIDNELGLDCNSCMSLVFQNSEKKLSSGIYCDDLASFQECNDTTIEGLFLPEWSENKQSSFKSYDYDESFIEELSKVEKNLAEIYKGAMEIQDIKPSDYKRHVADGFRELISNMIRILAPQDDVLKKWLLKTNRKQLLTNKHGKLVPTRKAKLIFIFRDRPKRERKLVEDEVKCIIRLYNILNGLTHSLTTDISEELLDNYVQKVKNSLKTLILLYNN